MDNKLDIINYLGKHLNEQFTMHQLSNILNIPYATFYRKIKKMEDLIKIQTIGRSKVISLILNNITRSYLTISSEEEKKHFIKKQPIIKKIASELNTKDIVILFGSYAKRIEKESSDIDLLVINKNGNKSLSFSKYELLFKKKINPIFIAISEFRQMLLEKDENVGKQALKTHIILNNPEDFWRIVLNG